MTKNQKSLITTAFVFWITVAGYLWFINHESFLYLQNWSAENPLSFFLLLTTIKIIGIIWPPLPGGLMTIGSIPLLGWYNAYFIDLVGSIIGSSLAYYIGKKYGYKLLSKLFDEKIVDRIKNIKVKKEREIEATFTLRLIGGNTIMEAVCYGAGLLKIKYRNFLIGTIASHMLLGIPTFYFAGNFLRARNIALNAVLALITVYLIWKIKGRYFE